MKVAVIGGGAAGFFGALACAAHFPDCQVCIYEKHKQVLSKVRISGGGRCNVTHACFDPALLTHNYPRGNKALRGPFHQFQCRDTIDWFQVRGIELKIEKDGRMFPITDSSQTIIDCLLKEAHQLNIPIHFSKGLEDIQILDEGIRLKFGDQSEIMVDRVLLATGSSSKIWEILKRLGHKVIPPVPSLFTFNVPNHPLVELSGLSVASAEAAIEGTSLKQQGPLLITHWGFSGPAILKLSAWGARELHELDYKGILRINWIPKFTHEKLQEELLHYKLTHPTKMVATDNPLGLPRQLWKYLVGSILPLETTWNNLSKVQMHNLILKVTKDFYPINGKSTNKEEFVTCGGVDLKEINFKTMESRLCPGLYFAGEVVDIDGITGGFNFQNAWTTGWIAGNAIGKN